MDIKHKPAGKVRLKDLGTAKLESVGYSSPAPGEHRFTMTIVGADRLQVTMTRDEAEDLIRRVRVVLGKYAPESPQAWHPIATPLADCPTIPGTRIMPPTADPARRYAWLPELEESFTHACTKCHNVNVDRTGSLCMQGPCRGLIVNIAALRAAVDEAYNANNLRTYAGQPSRIVAIKKYRELTGSGLVEAKEAVESVMGRLNTW